MSKKIFFLLAVLTFVFSIAATSFAQTDISDIKPQILENIKIVIKCLKLDDFMNQAVPENVREEAYKHVVKLLDEQFSEKELKTIAEFLSTEEGNKIVAFAKMIRYDLMNYKNVN